MSVDSIVFLARAKRLAAVAALLSAWSGYALAAGPQEHSWSTWSDPLGTRPALLDQGRALPGDRAPTACAAAPGRDLPRLSLGEAVDLALCNNPKIRAAWAAIKERSAALGVAGATLMPTVSATVGRERTDTAYSQAGMPATVAKGNNVNGTLNWRIFDFGAREAERQAANSLLVGAIESHDATLQQVMEDAVQAYFDAQSAAAVLKAKGEGLAIAQATLDSVVRREKAGAVSHGDTLQVTTAVARAKLDRSRAEGDYRKTLAVLVHAMGLSADSTVDMAVDVDDPQRTAGRESSAWAHELDAWLHEAERTHPAILAASAQWEAAQSGIKSARASGLPSIDVSANYYRNGYPNQGLSANGTRVSNVGLFVSIPIFSGFSHGYQVRQAQAVAEEKQAVLDDTRHSVLMDVVKAHADARAALDILGDSSALLAVAEESMASSRRRFEKGAADIVEILNVQRALADAKQERIQSLAAWRSARLHLLAATGVLGHAGLDETTGLAIPVLHEAAGAASVGAP
jgi:outer membrane protein